MTAHIDGEHDQRSAQLWFTAWLGQGASCQLVSSENATSARASFDQDAFHLPRHNLAHHRASAAHFYAHKKFGGEQFSVGNFRPIQIVLTSLFEDARVEQLALHERPGLRRLWAPYIEKLETDGDDVAGLLRRLTIALFNPAGPVVHPWVEKARYLFCSRRSEWRNPALSRELGNLLGNDIGQMRLQFNWKSYVVEPVYRDDHRGLWYDDNDPAPQQEQRAGICPDDAAIQDAAIKSAAAPVAAYSAARRGEIGDWLSAAATRAVSAETLPEWDYARRFYRAAWVSVHEQAALPGDNTCVPEIVDAGALPQHWQRHTISTRRYRRGHDGDSLDLDACIRTVADRHLGHSVDLRIYRRQIEQQQPRTLLILIDCSLSMSLVMPLTATQDASFSVLDYAKAAALQRVKLGLRRADRFAIYGFCSDGRHALHMTSVKTFSGNFSWPEITARLASLHAAYSTRLGGALRYAKKLIANEPAIGREILVLSDGEVGDIDAVDPQYLREDARQALRELSDVGIAVDLVDCITMSEMQL